MARTVWGDLKVERDWVVRGGRENGQEYRKLWKERGNIKVRFGNPETGSIRETTAIYARVSDAAWHENNAKIIRVDASDPIPEGVRSYRIYVIDNPDPRIARDYTVREVPSHTYLRNVNKHIKKTKK